MRKVKKNPMNSAPRIAAKIKSGLGLMQTHAFSDGSGVILI